MRAVHGKVPYFPALQGRNISAKGVSPWCENYSAILILAVLLLISATMLTKSQRLYYIKNGHEVKSNYPNLNSKYISPWCQPYIKMQNQTSALKSGAGIANASISFKMDNWK
ncbi:hypothetical protein [Cyclobacterium amurskyense]|uniref:hypothetical protein n=1 Tax=Cyclobacterium amurskyense TaxID=320787 RepID=UPI00065E3392|nr:hypothetical protein [Cyclobacterium amurskyense]